MQLPAHVAQTVRRGDPDRYISVLYAPEDRRDSLLALYAFAHEIASTRERVREPLAGEIRLQWWRDVISAGPGGGQGSPVAEALLEAVRRHDLPTRPLLDLLDARVHDLYDDPIVSRNDLDGYCGETSSAIIQLACLILDPKLSADVATIAGHAGCAQAIAGMARTIPFQLARGQCPVPQDLLASVGTSAETLVAGTDREANRRALMALVALGQEHAGSFAAGAGTIPSSLRPAFLPAALAPAYLARVEAMGADALQRATDISPVRRHWILFRHAVFGWPAPG
jgi:15-cis-phytoene synthase